MTVENPPTHAPPQPSQPVAVDPIETGVVSLASTMELPAPEKGKYWFLVSTHAIIDMFPIYFSSLMIVLADRLTLTKAEQTAIWVITPVASGVLQPLFAWLGDRYDSRLPAPVGLAMGAVCISSIGFAQTFWQLVTLQIIGVIGVGMYHPTATATAGQLGGRAFRHGRSIAVSIFIAAGMLGHTIGPILSTRVNAAFGMKHLAWLIAPALVVALLLHLMLRHTPHRPHDHAAMRASLTSREATMRWVCASMLTIQNALRYTTNIGMFILFNYWAYAHIPGDPVKAASLNGNMAAAMTLGMGVGALWVGRFVRPGNEKALFASTAFIGAVFISSIGVAGQWGAQTFSTPWVGHLPAYAAAFIGSIGFFATIPSSIGLGHRLLPSHTATITALLMGVGWMVGALARPISSLVLGEPDIMNAHLIPDATINQAFLVFGLLLAASGLFAIAMPGKTLKAVASHD